MSVATMEDGARTTDVVDGYVYDVETGEVIGCLDLPDAWRGDTESAVEWALEKRAEIEARLVGIRARKAALLANLAAQEKVEERRLAWWDRRFGAEVVAFARRSLEGMRARTKRFAYGAVSFRATQGSTEIVDMEAAVAFVARYAPDAVKVVRTVGVKALDEAGAAFREVNGCEPSMPFAIRKGLGESVTIETGVA